MSRIGRFGQISLAVGSIELVFALLTSWLAFRETPSRAEIGGIALIGLGVAVTVLSR